MLYMIVTCIYIALNLVGPIVIGLVVFGDR